MEARRGRDAVGGSMRSTTARPAMFLGRGRPFNQRWTYRLDALDEMLLVRKGFCVCPAGQRYRAVPSTAPRLGARHRHRALQKKRVGPKEKALNGRRTVTALSSPATAKTRRVERSHMAASLRSATANISRSRCVKRRVRYACLGSAAACRRPARESHRRRHSEDPDTSLNRSSLHAHAQETIQQNGTSV